MPLFLLLFLFCSMSVFAQDTANIKSFKLYSTILEEERFFDIYIPSSKNKSEVIYVLDGQAQFTNVVNTLKQLGQNQKIVVGIGNIWMRERDYTPTHVSSAAISGGGKKFISHLEKELIPYINLHYLADTSRILIGHSFGGLIAIDILLNHSNLFHKYVVIDPAMWWDDGRLVNQASELLKKPFLQTSLFLAVADSQNTAQVRPGLLLLDYLKANPKNNIKLDWKYYRDHDHMSVFQPAVNDGLKFLLLARL